MTAHHVSAALIAARTARRLRRCPPQHAGGARGSRPRRWARCRWRCSSCSPYPDGICSSGRSSTPTRAGTSSAACPGDIGACWAFVVARWKPWLVGNYPAGELWRAWACFGAFALFWTWVVRRSARGEPARVLLGFVLLPVALCMLLIGGGPLPFVAPTLWGGLLLTLVVTLVTFATALPLGLCLALGRRSRLPRRANAVRRVRRRDAVDSAARGAVHSGNAVAAVPAARSNVDLFGRAVIAFALFNAAMAAEVFRGGLQSTAAVSSRPHRRSACEPTSRPCDCSRRRKR